MLEPVVHSLPIWDSNLWGKDISVFDVQLTVECTAFPLDKREGMVKLAKSIIVFHISSENSKWPEIQKMN